VARRTSSCGMPISSDFSVNNTTKDLELSNTFYEGLDLLYQPKTNLIKLYGSKSGTYTVDLNLNTPTISATNYIETTGTSNITIDWVNGTNITFTRVSQSAIKLKNGDITSFNVLVAFNRNCSVEYGAISYINGVAITTPQTFGNQDFSGVVGHTIVQALKYDMVFDLLTNEDVEYPIGTVFTTKLFKRQELASPTLTSRYMFGVNVNNIDRISYATIKTIV